MLRRSLALATLGFLFCPAVSATAVLEQISNHCYLYSPDAGGSASGIVATREGVLVIDPPAEAELPAMMEAVGEVTRAPVRWVVYTNYLRARSGGYRHLARRGAVLLTSRQMDPLLFPAPPPEPALPGPVPPWRESLRQEIPRVQPPPVARVVFEDELKLFPEDLEVRIIALRRKAFTPGDVVVFIPAENVLQAGDVFIPGNFPALDVQGGDGNALGWLEGMRQVIAAVPLLKPAIPQPKPDIEGPPEEEKTLDELVRVIPGSGPVCTLKDMKELEGAARKLRAQAQRAVALKRVLATFLNSAALAEFRALGNTEQFATQLYESLQATAAPPDEEPQPPR
ncbi:MAG: hypothetical protein ABIG68_12835 [Acidobacteriota bacterium]